MSIKFYTFLVIVFMTSTLNAQMVLNEILIYSGFATIELHNQGVSSVDVSGYYFHNFPTSMALADMTNVYDTDLVIGGDEFVVLTGLVSDNVHGEVGLYMNDDDFADSDNLVDYMEYGEGGHQREPVAVAAGQWTVGGFVVTPNFLMGHSMAYDGDGNAPSDWQDVFPPTADASNVRGVEELSVSSVIMVYPNPSTEKISVQCSQKGMVRLFDVRGSLVKEVEKTTGEVVIDMSDVVNGNYFVELNGRTVQFRIEN